MSLSLLFPFAVKRSRASTPVVVPLGSLLVPALAGGGRGLLTATARSVGALSLAVTVLDPWIDTGHTVTACGVTGGGLLTAPGCVISVHVFPLPTGEIGVTASGHTLSRIARVTARGHAGDYLALLPACVGGAKPAGQTRIPGGCWGGCLSASCDSEAAAAVPPFAGGAVFAALPSALQGLARCFLSLSRSFSLWQLEALQE